MRRSSIIMLIAAVALGLIAVLFARTFLNGSDDSAGPASAAVRTVPTAIAATDIKFGQKITPEMVKVVDWPANTLPQGSFQRMEELTMGAGRTAMRPIVANEILTENSLATGANRLSTAPLLNPQMRAVSVPVNEVSGVAGLIFPGDRVDVFMTRPRAGCGRGHERGQGQARNRQISDHRGDALAGPEDRAGGHRWPAQSGAAPFQR
jgi:pilus assembly protein CpaB